MSQTAIGPKGQFLEAAVTGGDGYATEQVIRTCALRAGRAREIRAYENPER